jgi:hypothetical protein
MKYIEWLWTWIPKLFTSKPKPDPAPALTDDMDVSLFHWRGPSGANAKLTINLTNVKRKGGNLYYKAGDREWALKDSCDSYTCLFRVRDGQGGKFDWSRPKETMKPLNHMVVNGYLDNRYPNEEPILPPVEGEEWAFLLLKRDGTERSRAAKISVSRPASLSAGAT